MPQRSVPFHFFRGGTSRGPYFLAKDLPEDRDALSAVLISVMGAGNPRNIDGLGGGTAVTTKVAILSPSSHPEADVDYLFAQVAVHEPLVDFGPTCGNMLVAVGPAALELGLAPIHGPETTVRIHAVNTGALVDARIQTPEGAVTYAGDTALDGMPGTAAPIGLSFRQIAGSRTGATFPTGKVLEDIDGIQVSCIDVAMPMMIARAEDFGITGYENQAELDAMPDLFARMEPIRIEAGRRMGLGDVGKSVVPKIGLLAAPRQAGQICVRYFMPWSCHPTLAVTGSQCIAASLLAPGTVAEGLAKPIAPGATQVTLEHPMGAMAVEVDYEIHDGQLDFRGAGVTRTARMIARGEVLIPEAVWP